MRHAAVPVLSGEKLFGHVAEMRSDRMSFIRRLGSECRDMMRVRFFSKTAYFVGSPPLLHEVFVDKAKSFGKTGMMRYMLYPVAGEGLFTSNGALWRQQRKLMSRSSPSGTSLATPAAWSIVRCAVPPPGATARRWTWPARRCASP